MSWVYCREGPAPWIAPGCPHNRRADDQARRNAATGSTWLSAISVGACPTPGTSSAWARGLRLSISSTVAGVSKSDSAPRTISTGQDTAS
ncbi:hypothetical protein G6F31_020587 [Rhizopus arrhizus]|nr:hypothetical protein G6F31_020587 [Rhizopus arrhizus]